MLKVSIPGWGDLHLEHLVMDFNGTLAQDGALIGGVPEAIRSLSGTLAVHVVSADTFGTVRDSLRQLPCKVEVIGPTGQDRAKHDYVNRLGARHVAAIGNGRNDRLMIEAAALGIAVILGEGACVETLQTADIVCTDILTALGLFQHPLRLVAALRS